MLKCKDCSATFTEESNTGCPKSTVEEKYHSGKYAAHRFPARDDQYSQRDAEVVIRWNCCFNKDKDAPGCETRQVSKPGGKHIPTAESVKAKQEADRAKQEAEKVAAAAAKEAALFAAFPVATSSEIAADVRAASEAYNAKRVELVARAKAVEVVESGTAAAGTAHDDDVARLTTELAAMKAAKDFKGMKAAKVALEAAKVAEVASVVPAEYVAGDTLESLREEADKLCGEWDEYYASGFAIGDPSKYGRLSALQDNADLSGAYLRESERLIEADDYDLAEVYDTAATAAAENWGLEPGIGDWNGWNHWFPRRLGNDEKWGPLYECDEDA